MVLRNGDRIRCIRGSYLHRTGVWIENRGMLSCSVRLDGDDDAVTIRRTSVQALPNPSGETEQQQRRRVLQNLNARLAVVTKELNGIQEQILALSLG